MHPSSYPARGIGAAGTVAAPAAGTAAAPAAGIVDFTTCTPAATANLSRVKSFDLDMSRCFLAGWCWRAGPALVLPACKPVRGTADRQAAYFASPSFGPGNSGCSVLGKSDSAVSIWEGTSRASFAFPSIAGSMRR